MTYSNQEFESAFQLVTAVSHQVVKVDFAEMENWVDKLLGPRALKEKDTKVNLDNLKTVMRSFAIMQEVLRTNGIPVRDIKHYKDAIPSLASNP